MSRNIVRAQLLAALHLPYDAILLYCPQTLVKIHPRFDTIADRVLKALPRATLVLLEGSGPAWSTQLRQRQAITMAHAARVHILPRLSAFDFAAMLLSSDVVMDSVPYSSFTISLEALTVGTPVVTLDGNALREYVVAGGCVSACARA